jgi:UDP-glucose 4-epimerase
VKKIRIILPSIPIIICGDDDPNSECYPMNIVITGISSFTGLYFVKELHRRKHNIFGVHQSSFPSYSSPHKERVTAAISYCQESVQASFGEQSFCSFIQQIPIDVYCHHGAYTTNYNAVDFPIQYAVEKNTKNLSTVANILREKKCHSIAVSSSIFAGHGPISSSDVPFSGYGESKWQTDQLFLDACKKHQLRWARYVIPNPFGPQDNPKFLYEMGNKWSLGEPLVLKTPDFIRDNIHVRLLAEHYASWIENLQSQPSQIQSFPSGYVEKIGDFAERVAIEMRKRTGWACDIQRSKKPMDNQPTTLHNTEVIKHRPFTQEQTDWDLLAEWFQEIKETKSTHP